MSLTRANTEFMIVASNGPLLTAAGMAVTVVGSNASLNAPIGHAIRQLGHTVASAVLVTDADVAGVTDAETDEFLGLAELYTLEAILGNLDDVDITVGPRTEKLNQLAKQVESKIERASKALAKTFGYGLSVPAAGYIQKNIAEHA